MFFFLEWGWILIELGILMNRLFSFWLLFGRGQGTMEFGFNQEIMKVEACVCGNCVESDFLKCLYF
jgi:hypothetical protein